LQQLVLARPGGTHSKLVEEYDGPFAEELDVKLEPNQQTDLRTLDSAYRLSPGLKAKKPKGAVVTVQSRMVPTFETTNIDMVYQLSAAFEFKCPNKTLSANLSGQELVILPDHVSLTLPRKPPELDSDGAILELASGQLEIGSGYAQLRNGLREDRDAT
ncbi:hypothetical protein MMC13_001852, partial [Lambiella insularis]|nr:hypothetical protein [Lambiella insularis]